MLLGNNILPWVGVGSMGAAVFLFSRFWMRRYAVVLRTWPFHDIGARVFSIVDSMRISPGLYRFGRGRAIQALLSVSGFTPSWTGQRFLALKKISLLASGGLAVLMIWQPSPLPMDQALALLLLLLLSWFWPELYLRRYVVLRKSKLQKMLAYVIDVLRLQVGAGSSLESSFRVLARFLRGEWGRELSHLIFLLDHGVGFEEALRRMAARIALEDFSRFALAVRQAQTLGASLTDTLVIQAEMLRNRRRGRAEARARLASVKIAIPLVFFIFPALLVIYLAPAVLRIVQLF